MYTNNYELKCAIEKQTEDLLIKTEHINKLLLPDQNREKLPMTSYAESNLAEFLNCQLETLAIITAEVDIASAYVCNAVKFDELPQAEAALEKDEGKAFEQIFEIKERCYYISRTLYGVLDKLTDTSVSEGDDAEKSPTTVNGKLNKVLDIILDAVDAADMIITYLEREEIIDPECEKSSESVKVEREATGISRGSVRTYSR